MNTTDSRPADSSRKPSRRLVLTAAGAGASGLLLAAGAARGRAAKAATAPAAGPVQLFTDPGLNFSALTALGAAGYGATEVGEVITAVNTINAAGATYDAFTDTFLSWGDTLAQQSAQASDPVTKGELALRSSAYYAQALFYVLGTTQPGRELALYQACRASWDVFVSTVQPAVRQFSVTCRSTRIPPGLFRPDDSDELRPTLILTIGSDGQNEALWSYGA